MIIVKTIPTFRVKGKIIPSGAIYRAKNKEDLPEWLLEEMKLCEITLTRNTLIITEIAPPEQISASNGEELVKEETYKTTEQLKAEKAQEDIDAPVIERAPKVMRKVPRKEKEKKVELKKRTPKK